MDLNTYRLLHIVGILALFIGLGGMFAGSGDVGKRKIFGISHGVGLLLLLIAGFGMLAKLGLGFPLFAIIKLVLWLALGALPVLARKQVLSTGVTVIVAIVLAGIATWIGLNWATVFPVAIKH